MRDCFDLAEQPRARALNRYAGHLREEQQIDGFRILNKQGRSVLQTYIGYQKWTKHSVQPEELEPYCLTKQQREQQQQEGSNIAVPATAPFNITQQAQHATQTRPRGGGQCRGAARGAAKGGRAASGAGAAAQPSQQLHHRSPAPVTCPNNIPISSGGWKPTRQAQTKKRMQIYKQKQQKSSEHQSTEQIPMQSAPLSAQQGEQERHQKDKEDAEALRWIDEAAAEKKDTILRRKAAREAAKKHESL